MRCACIEADDAWSPAGSLTDETRATETLLRAGDLTLLTAAPEQAAADGLELASFVTRVARCYADEASD